MMKIPETSANIGAYYGSDEHGQWQPNGVIIDSGVGGGVVGSGDAGIHRPPVYPVHIPRGHVPAGYVMTGPFYPPAGYAPVPPPTQDDFADYMWMENEEEFDKQVMQQLEEEALMEQCIEAMLEDEQRERQQRPVTNGHNHLPTTSNGSSNLSLEETVSRSTLNPLAAEFVPTRVRAPPQPPTDVPEVQQSSTETSPTPTEETLKSREVEEPTVDSKPETTEEPKTEEPVPPPKDPPEVSAADVLPIDKQDKRPKDKRDVKKPVKVDLKKKPLVVKSETKVQSKKKEVKCVKSDGKVDEKCEEIITAVEEIKIQPTPTEETTAVPSMPGIKPINYAAAAKANKPKKPTTPPATDKSTPPPQTKVERPKIIDKKDKVKIEKPGVQRKNSAK